MKNLLQKRSNRQQAMQTAVAATSYTAQSILLKKDQAKAAKIVAKASNNLISALQETSAQGAKSLKNAVTKKPTKLHASSDEKDGSSRSSDEKDSTKLREKFKKVVEKVNIQSPTKLVQLKQKHTNYATSETSENIPISDRALFQKSSARTAKSKADKAKKIWRFPASSSNIKNQNEIRLILYRALLHDMGLICGLLILPCAGLATLINYRLVFQVGKIPTSVLWVWFLSIFVVGMEVGRIRGLRQATRNKTDEEAIDTIPPGYLLLCQNLPKLLRLLHPNDDIEIQLRFFESSPNRNVRLSSLARKSQGKLLSRKNDINDIKNSVKSGLSLQLDIPTENRMGQVDVFDNPVGPDLLKAAASSANTNQSSTIPPSPREIKPVLWLRGLDCFLGPPQDDLSNHDFLIARGLRNVPTFLVNVQLCFGNILLYFGLPDWFTDFDDLKKTSQTTLKNDSKDEDTLDDDRCSTKASLINFLIGSDEYRNSRLSFMSHLVNGPMPIRLLAPPAGQEMLVAQQHRGISTKWIDHPRRDNLKPCLEIEVDLVSSNPLRQLSLLCKRYVKTVQLDLALMLSDTATNGAVKHSVNDGNTRKESNVYFGFWRFDYIDIDTFSGLPERKTSEGVEENVENEINGDSEEEEGDVVEDNGENKITKAEFRILKRDIQHASQLYTSLSKISTEGTKA
eukprot:CAMPEP_0178935054 /NCGR_PEP_ID=MMETSP0786-20121207/24280_1 /TAXON_ID=186022 /ORGANISM="Thalassionema frauenfeldii, Strain CCMP 1798" /LENGTH=681 /DNA_ID=CAMNT_0020613055 /DNA_START=296 /DNA_END=2340 /DNA_ORIENTATION=+